MEIGTDTGLGIETCVILYLIIQNLTEVKVDLVNIM